MKTTLYLPFLFLLGCEPRELPQVQGPRSVAHSTAQPTFAVAPPVSTGPIPLADAPKADANGTTAQEPAAVSDKREAARANDDATLEILRAANAGEIELATRASAKARDSRVRRFAEALVREHTESDRLATELSARFDLKAVPSQVSESIVNDTKEMSASLASQSGDAFDRMYVEKETRVHLRLLEALDGKVVAGVQEPELKAFVASYRSKVARHFATAKELDSRMHPKLQRPGTGVATADAKHVAVFP